MQRSISKKILLNSFWLSIILHLLMLLIFSTYLQLRPEEEKKPPHYFRSYVYNGAITPQPSLPQINQKRSAQTNTQKPNIPKPPPSLNAELPTDKISTLKIHKAAEDKESKPEKTQPTANDIQPKSMLATSNKTLKTIQRREMKAQKEDEPIYLVGDLNAVADPIIKLLGRALTANFKYPKVAEELGITGRVIIGLTLHPEGNFTDVQMVSSSNNHDLDSAALYAVNTAPLVEGANRFLSKPKHFVVGFIFREYQEYNY